MTTSVNGRLARDWNRAHPSGTPVRVTRTDGTMVESRTVGDAWPSVCHGAAVVVVESEARPVNLLWVRAEKGGG